MVVTYGLCLGDWVWIVFVLGVFFEGGESVWDGDFDFWGLGGCVLGGGVEVGEGGMFWGRLIEWGCVV